MENKDSKFEYSYSAPTEKERQEIESIRRQYEVDVSSKEGKLERIKKLDAKVKNTATIWSLALGVIGTLIFGTGMTLVLEMGIVIGGVACGALGLLPIFAAYPIYNVVLTRQKKKYGQEILKLSEQLLNENTDEQRAE